MKTEILVITDRSGSMAGLTDSVIEGYNKFLADQRAVPGEARITYTQFDHEYQVVYQGRDIQAAPQLDRSTFVPRGMTALNDAIGHTLDTQGKRITAEGWADLVIVYIITDGGENSSKDYTGAQVKTMLEHAQAHGWQVLYLAANQDAFAVASQMGINANNVANFAANAVSTQSAYLSASVATAAYRTGAANVTMAAPDLGQQKDAQ